ncbi:MAG: ROK family protein [Candidatus Nanopelagicales bacterium]
MSALFAGSDLGGTSIATVIATASGSILGADRRPTPRRSVVDEVPAAIAGSVHAAIVDAGCDPTDVVSVGVGCPGQVDRAAGTFGNASTLPDWPASFPLAAEVGRHLSRPVVLDNDVRLAVEAEIASGSGRTFPSFLGVFVGTGVGAGLVLDGSLWFGRGNAGEFGHMVVDFTPDARPCSCGRTGCVQAYAGRGGMEAAARAAVAEGRRTALFDLMEFRDRDRLTSSVWEQSVRGGDPLARELVDTAAQALGAALGSTVNLVDVDGIVLGGGLAAQLGEPFREAVADAMGARVLGDSIPPVRLTSLGDLSGALGAAMLAARS